MDESELWQPFPRGSLGDFTPQPGRLMSAFREACHLCAFAILGGCKPYIN